MTISRRSDHSFFFKTVRYRIVLILWRLTSLTKFFSDIFPRTVILGHLASVCLSIIRSANNEAITSLLKDALISVIFMTY